MKSILSIIFLWLSPTVFCTAQSDIETLTKKITAEIPSDSLKVKAIYIWITQNITYDYQFRRRIEGDTTLTQEAYNVLKRQKAVCVGFSKLLKSMCAVQGIEAIVVYGYAKGQGFIYDYEGHAWNAVKLNQQWYLLDATWGSSGNLSAEKYLFSDPISFLDTHIPTDPMWQLVDKPITIECFTNRKNCYTEYTTAFNYRDTIAAWQLLDSLGKECNEAIRILRFNENDTDAIRQLGGYYFQKAFTYFAEYQGIKQAVRSKKRKPDNAAYVLNLLDNAEYQLMGAKAQYEKLKTFAKKHRYTDAHMNLEMLEENFAQLATERAFVKTYFK
jgi:hypothetical protein